MGRPKKIITRYDIAAMEWQGRRLRKYRESEQAAQKILKDARFDDGRRRPYPTREEFGRHYGCTRASVQRYEEGKLLLPDAIAGLIEKDTGIASRYWQGIIGGFENPENMGAYDPDYDDKVSKMTPIEYGKYIILERGQSDCIEQEIVENPEYYDVVISKYEQFFAALSFAYEYQPPTAEEDFSGIEGAGTVPVIPKPHALTRYSSSELPCRFSDTDFFTLIEKLQNTVAFACFENNRV